MCAGQHRVQCGGCASGSDLLRCGFTDGLCQRAWQPQDGPIHDLRGTYSTLGRRHCWQLDSVRDLCLGDSTWCPRYCLKDANCQTQSNADKVYHFQHNIRPFRQSANHQTVSEPKARQPCCQQPSTRISQPFFHVYPPTNLPPVFPQPFFHLYPPTNLPPVSPSHPSTRIPRTNLPPSLPPVSPQPTFHPYPPSQPSTGFPLNQPSTNLPPVSPNQRSTHIFHPAFHPYPPNQPSTRFPPTNLPPVSPQPTFHSYFPHQPSAHIPRHQSLLTTQLANPTG